MPCRTVIRCHDNRSRKDMRIRTVLHQTDGRCAAKISGTVRDNHPCGIQCTTEAMPIDRSNSH